MKLCICADPENCVEIPEGRICKRLIQECQCERCKDHIADKPGRTVGQRYIDALVKADHYSLMFRTARASSELDECSRPRT